MKIAVTGHREISQQDWVADRFRDALHMFKPEVVITGGAVGTDLLAAKVAFQEGFAFDLYRPWAGHGDSNLDYGNAMRFAHEVVNVSPSNAYLGPWLYQARNEAMVNNADMVISVHDGAPGGTYNCIKYATRRGYKIWNINPLTKEVGWL